MEDIIVTESGLVFAVMVVDTEGMPDFSTTINHGEQECPSCGSTDTMTVKHPCPYHSMDCYMWYCNDCLLLWEYRLVGEENAKVDNQTEDSQATRDSRIPTTD